MAILFMRASYFDIRKSSLHSAIITLMSQLNCFRVCGIVQRKEFGFFLSLIKYFTNNASPRIHGDGIILERDILV